MRNDLPCERGVGARRERQECPVAHLPLEELKTYYPESARDPLTELQWASDFHAFACESLACARAGPVFRDLDDCDGS